MTNKIRNVAALVAVLALVGCGSDGGGPKTDAKPSVDVVTAKKAGKYEVIEIPDDVPGDYSRIVRWCEGPILYSMTEKMFIDTGWDGGYSTSAIATSVDGCKDGVPR